MILFTFAAVYLLAGAAFAAAIFVLHARGRDASQVLRDDLEQMRALRPARASMAGGGVFSTQA